MARKRGGVAKRAGKLINTHLRVPPAAKGPLRRARKAGQRAASAAKRRIK
jgi:hypothetical protein